MTLGIVLLQLPRRVFLYFMSEVPLHRRTWYLSRGQLSLVDGPDGESGGRGGVRPPDCSSKTRKCLDALKDNPKPCSIIRKPLNPGEDERAAAGRAPRRRGRVLLPDAPRDPGAPHRPRAQVTHPTLGTTQGQIHGFFSQRTFK